MTYSRILKAVLPILFVAMLRPACADAVRGDELTQWLSGLPEKTGRLVRESLEHIGTDYRYGGISPGEGFDCSGFVQWVYKSALGKTLPRTARAQSQSGQPVLKRELKPGDLIFFNTRRAFSHVGIYLGSGRFIHSPRRGKTVRVDDMNLRYWAQRFNGARRIVEPALPPAAVRFSSASALSAR